MELLVIEYKNIDEAETARQNLLELNSNYMVSTFDAVIATKNKKGKVVLNQLVNQWPTQISGGAILGLLVGAIFFNPLLGFVAGAAGGALSASLTDYGINDAFMKKTAAILDGNEAALFIMTNGEITDKVIESLGKDGGEILRTNLDSDKEQALITEFKKSQKELTAVK